MTKNKLKLNPTKTEFLILSSSRNDDKIATQFLKLEDGFIQRSDTVRNLGMTMDSHLDMHVHISNIRKTCYY